MNSDIFETKPRWPGAPPICLAQNLPSFESKPDALAFHERNAPGSAIIRMGKCDACGMFHYTSKPRPPSGSSSGTGRQSK